MKRLIMINGTMGVGKTATAKELQKLLPDNVFLDGDWCWNMSPFIVNDETKRMVIENIVFLLNNFLSCSIYENVIFCWVMQSQKVIDEIVKNIKFNNYKLHVFSLICSQDALVKRISKDIDSKLRTEDVIVRSLERLGMYEELDTTKIDVTEMSACDAARMIRSLL